MACSGFEATKFAIKKLDSSNYQLWKFKLEMLLSKDDLWDVVVQPKPNPSTEDWEKKDRQARATISLSVEDDQLVHIRNELTAKGMWEALKNLYERPNLTSKLYLLRKLYKMRLTNDQTMQGHITSMLEVVEKLRGIGEDIKQDHVAAILLCSLPDEYSPLITALEARPESELTLDFVRGKLIDEWARRQETKTDSSKNQEIALKAEGRQFKKDFRTCYYCKRVGHVKSRCRKLSFDVAKQKSNQVSAKEAVAEKDVEENLPHVCFGLSSNVSSNGWYIDSGASSHMTSNQNFFKELDTGKTDVIFLADGTTVKAAGMGKGYLMPKCNKNSKILVDDVLYVPNLNGNLLSVRKLTHKGFSVTFRGDKCIIKQDDKLVAVGEIDQGLFKLQTHEAMLAQSMTNKSCKNCIHVWHRRLGHRDPNAIKALVQKDLATGIELKDCDKLQKCVCCIKGKMVKSTFPKDGHEIAKEVLDLVHTDLCGPLTTTPGGKKYVLVFIDDYSRYSVIYLLHEKSEVANKLKDYVAMVETKFGKTPKIFRSDNGGEYVNKVLEVYFSEKGIQHQFTVPFSPEQNGAAERKNRSLVEMVRCMLIDAKLPKKYWGEAIMTANYLQNRLPTKPVDVTPYELWNQKKPDLSNIRTFGCKVLAAIPKEKRKKLDESAEEGIFVGYDENVKGYRILVNDNKVILRRSVEFLEDDDSSVLIQFDKEVTPQAEELDDEIIVYPLVSKVNTENKCCQSLHTPSSSSIDSDLEAPRRSERITKGIPPKKLTYLAQSCSYEPQSFEDVSDLPEPERKHWIKAMQEEMDSIEKNNTWELVDLPANQKAIGCRWVFRIKDSADGKTKNYKARLVAKGYDQKYGRDYDETFAPVVKYATVRTLLAVAAQKNLSVKHFDVKSAFLNGKLQEDIFMEQPPGHIKEGKEDKVCKLRRSLYGLKQSARTWNETLSDVLEKQGFGKSEADSCLYVKKDEQWMYVLIYVDDLLVFAETEKHIDVLFEALNEHFEVKDLGMVSNYLGLEIERDDNGNYWIHQNSKIYHLIQKFGLIEAKTASTPMDISYTKIESDNLLPNNVQYQEAIGSLLYISTVSRPDISAAVGILSRRVSQPRQCDWNAVKRILCYLKGTMNYKLGYMSSGEAVLQGFCDSDWAGDSSDRKSTSGYVFMFGESAISWASKKQTCVALSSSEAELMAASLAAQECVWLRSLFEDIGLSQNSPVVIYEDNQACIKLALSGQTSARTKHIGVKHHYLKDLQDKGLIRLTYCPTEEQLADLLTKALSLSKFKTLLSRLKLTDKE